MELPLNGRNAAMLVLMVGAAVNTGDVSGQRNRADSVAISVAGGLRTGVAYVLDGAMHNDRIDNTNMPFPFRTRCRSSASPRAACRPRTACTRARRSTP